MSDEEKSKSWWYTLPGVLTSLAAVVTALAGLVVALKQVGLFAPESPPAATTQSIPAPTSPSGAAAPVVPAQHPAPADSPTPQVRTTYSVALPPMRNYKLGDAEFTLLKADVSAQTSEKDALQLRIRMMNHNDKFDENFWDRSFRLIVNGVPVAPESDLDEVVHAQSAKEGNVIFVLPHGTTGGNLKIIYADDSTEIPLALQSP
jgi:hypothetical protein